MLTPHFTLDEFVTTSTGLPNVPNEMHKRHIRFVAGCLEHARQALNKPIYINSAFRSKEVNAAVGGSPSSLHLSALAVDIPNRNIKYTEMSKFLRALLDTDPYELYPISHQALHVSWHPQKRNIINETFDL